MANDQFLKANSKTTRRKLESTSTFNDDCFFWGNVFLSFDGLKMSVKDLEHCKIVPQVFLLCIILNTFFNVYPWWLSLLVIISPFKRWSQHDTQNHILDLGCCCFKTLCGQQGQPVTGLERGNYLTSRQRLDCLDDKRQLMIMTAYVVYI